MISRVGAFLNAASRCSKFARSLHFAAANGCTTKPFTTATVTTHLLSNSEPLYRQRIWKCRLIGGKRTLSTDSSYTKPKSTNIISTLKERGLVQDFFPPREEPDACQLLKSTQQLIYAGFDATGPSLHIGHLIVYMALIHLARAGHRIAAVVGGATAMIGDPSGRNSERDPLQWELVQENCRLIEGSLRRIWENHSNNLWDNRAHSHPLIDPLILNNLTWYKGVGVIDFMSQAARHIRVGRMLSRKVIEDRLKSTQQADGSINHGEGISLAEFSYQLFQAHDWFHLNQKYGCRFQIGGSDQMGNIHSGFEYINDITEQHVYGMTVPLLTGEMGDKLGKTTSSQPDLQNRASGRSSAGIWLDRMRTTPFQLYQFFIRQPDSTVQHLLKVFTFFNPQELESMTQNHLRKKRESGWNQWYLQQKLAREVLLLVHGQRGLESAIRVSDILYGEPDRQKISTLDEDEFNDLFSESPSIRIISDPDHPTSLLDAVMRLKCFPSSNQAIRTIQRGGVSVNFERVTDPQRPFDLTTDILPQGVTLIRRGKLDYYVIKWN